MPSALYEIFSKPIKNGRRPYRRYDLTFVRCEPLFTLRDDDQTVDGRAFVTPRPSLDRVYVCASVGPRENFDRQGGIDLAMSSRRSLRHFAGIRHLAISIGIGTGLTGHSSVAD